MKVLWPPATSSWKRGKITIVVITHIFIEKFHLYVVCMKADFFCSVLNLCCRYHVPKALTVKSNQTRFLLIGRHPCHYYDVINFQNKQYVEMILWALQCSEPWTKECNHFFCHNALPSKPSKSSWFSYIYQSFFFKIRPTTLVTFSVLSL